ncbi:MAG: RsmE family RNA methyltransferase, partial [Pseudomonadota bacterium]
MRNKSNLHVRLHSLASLDTEARVALDHQQQHYLMHVMRLGDGDQIYLFNAANGEWQARLDLSGGDFQAICSHMIRPGEPLSGPVLYCSPIRRVAQEWLLQKACELGVSKLTPVLMDHTQAGPIHHDRAGRILREASEQSGRVTVPIIDQPISFDAMLELTKT